VRKSGGDAGGLVYGLSQEAGSHGAALAGHLMVVPARMAYLQITADSLRAGADALFPGLAKNQIADCVTGMDHRYRAGHDLLLDVPSTMAAHGPAEGLRQAGHIILTDFPTRAGIPIPGFSDSGLGHLLEQAGISSGWMQLSFFDTWAGLFIFSDGASNLLHAMQGSLEMGVETAFQTFGAGTVDLVFAAAMHNPIALAGGIENLLAGLVSTWETYSVYVDPLDFLGAAGMSALLGFGIAYGLANQNLGDATKNAIRSGAVGALFSVTPAFGVGAFVGFAVMRLASALARRHDSDTRKRLSVDANAYRMLVEEIRSGNIAAAHLIDHAFSLVTLPYQQPILDSTIVTLPDSPRVLDTTPPTLDATPRVLDTTPPTLDAAPSILSADPAQLSFDVVTLPDDLPALAELFRTALIRAAA